MGRPASLAVLARLGRAGALPDRAHALHARELKGFAIDTYEANYSFLIRELLTSEKKAVEAVKTARGFNAKTKAFEMAYERAGVKAYARRYEWAKRSLEAYRAFGRQPAPRPAFGSAAGGP